VQVQKDFASGCRSFYTHVDGRGHTEPVLAGPRPQLVPVLRSVAARQALARSPVLRSYLVASACSPCRAKCGIWWVAAHWLPALYCCPANSSFADKGRGVRVIPTASNSLSTWPTFCFMVRHGFGVLCTGMSNLACTEAILLDKFEFVSLDMQDQGWGNRSIGITMYFRHRGEPEFLPRP
jgi:hypothetical protein